MATGLNCLIGARGTGKTTILELIRFALDALPSPELDPAARRRVESLIEQNLAGGRVELAIETADGLTYTITRAAGEDPIILDAGGRATEITLGAGAFFRADIYSQNEIESIADRATSQLKLLDRFEPERIATIHEQFALVYHALASNAGQLGPLQARLAGLAEELGALPGIEEKLRGYGAGNGESVEAINKAHALKALRDREVRAVASAGEFLNGYSQQLKGLVGCVHAKVHSIFSGDVGTGPNAEALAAIKRMLLNSGSELDTSLAAAHQRVELTLNELRSSWRSLSLSQHQQELAFRALIEQHEAAQGQAVERSRLERTRNDLLAKQRAREELRAQLADLQIMRTDMLHRLSELRDELFAIRRAVAERITLALRGTVRVRVLQSGNPEEYLSTLMDALRSSRLKHGVVAQKLVNAFMPARLVEIVRSGDTRPLVEEAEINEEQARKVVEALSSSEALYRLEAVDLPDLPSVELNDGGEYKPSQSLSTGQKCTTILPILLLESNNPLLIDQPEDNLDNRFIFECVVASIREMKPRRQMIFVTHNPNIPVLGDAEQVFVLESDGGNARLVRSGTVDECRQEIVTLLEGGEEAFKQRQNRYAY